jgi:hypothetical protein
MSIQVRSNILFENIFHTYLDLEISNAPSNPPVPLSFIDTRNNPILQNAGEYFISIVKLSLDTWSIPNYIPFMDFGKPLVVNPAGWPAGSYYATEYTVSIETAGGTFTQPVYWIPEDTTQSPPPSPLSVRDATSPYFYGNSFTHLISLFNYALGRAHTLSGLGGVSPPFFRYIDSTASIDVFFPPLYYTVATNKVFLNTAAFSVFNSLPNRFYGNNPVAKNYELIYIVQPVSNPILALNAVTLGGNSYIRMSQEFPTLKIINPVESFVFTTNLLPVNLNLVSAPRVFGSDFTGIGNNANVSGILTDFVPNLTFGFETNSLTYIPSAEYRLIDLLGTNTTITSIDINGFWKDVQGILHPIMMNPGASGSIKILFRRKDFETGTMGIPTR